MWCLTSCTQFIHVICLLMSFMEEALRGCGNHACSTHHFKCSYHTRLVCTTHQRSVLNTLLFGCAYYTFMMVCYAHHKRCAYRGIGSTPYLVCCTHFSSYSAGATEKSLHSHVKHTCAISRKVHTFNLASLKLELAYTTSIANKQGMILCANFII